MLQGCAAAPDDPLAARREWVSFTTQEKSSETINALLYRPKGAGPFGVVFVLHTGGGVSETERSYGSSLQDWGYMALVIDSYGSRNIRGTASIGYQRGTYHQLADLYGAMSYLKANPDVDPERFAVIGFSRGGHTALMSVGVEATLPDYLRTDLERPAPVRVGIGIYPSCLDIGSVAAEGKTLILIGDRDSERNIACSLDVVKRANARGIPAEITIYKNTTHSFVRESRNPEWEFNGEAAANATIQTRRFLAEHLR